MFLSFWTNEVSLKVMNPGIKFLIMFKGNNDKSETYL